MALEQFANSPTPATPSTPWSTLASPYTAGGATLTVVDASAFPAVPQFRILIDSKRYVVTAVAGEVFSVTVEDGATASHASGANVYHVVTKAGLARHPRSMTTRGDIEYMGADLGPTRIPIGAVGTLFVSGTDPGWTDTGLTYTTTPVGGVMGLYLNKSSADVTNSQAVVYAINGAPKWASGMDVGNAQYVPVFDFSIPGDIMRHAVGGKTVLGPGVGDPAANTAFFTIDVRTGAPALHALEGMIVNDSRRGIVIGNTSAGSGASALFQLNSDVGAGSLNLEMFSSGFSGIPNQAWVYAGGATTPLIFGTQGAERMRIAAGGGVSIAAMTSGRIVGVGASGLLVDEAATGTGSPVRATGPTFAGLTSSGLITANANIKLAVDTFIGFTGVTAVDYALYGNATNTFINVPTSGQIGLRVNNEDRLVILGEETFLRHGTNAQILSGYASYTDGSNYTRWAMTTAQGTPGNVTLAAESAGSGSANIDIILTPKGTGILSTPASFNAAGTVNGINLYTNSAVGSIGILSSFFINCASNGVVGLFNWAGTDFDRLQAGGTTNLFPSWQRSSADWNARLADDSAYTRVRADYFLTRKTAAPADGDLATSEMAVWFDHTNGAAKLKIKGKSADGTVVTGEVALA